jgi:hypothetical protein
MIEGRCRTADLAQYADTPLTLRRDRAVEQPLGGSADGDDIAL